MKKRMKCLLLCMVLSVFSSCTLHIPILQEAKEVVGAYTQYKKTGELPSNIHEILGNQSVQASNNPGTGGIQASEPSPSKTPSGHSGPSPELPGSSSQGILERNTPSKTEILELARHYYEFVEPKIESGTRSEFQRLVTWKPDFSGKEASSQNLALQKHSSVNVALALSYTNAKNFYLAMAASVFSINPEDSTAAGNFAAAVAAYADDLLLEGAAGAGVQQYYADAEKIYLYALLSAKSGEGYTPNALPFLVSLGNLYLDGSKFNEAYACFQAALELNGEYWPAIEGLYNTYIAMNQLQKALDLIAEKQKFPVFLNATMKLSEKQEQDLEKPFVQEFSADESVLEKKLESFSTIESVSTADFLDAIDQEAKKKLEALIREVQGKMRYTAPDMNFLFQYSSLKAISAPAGESALEAFAAGKDSMEEIVEKLNDELYKTDIPEEKLAQIEALAGTFAKNQDAKALKNYYSAMAEVYPEYSVYALNPFDYANPLDVIIQRHNIENFNTKFIAYRGYLGKVNYRVAKEIDDIIQNCQRKTDEFYRQMDAAEAALPDNASQNERHAVHLKYYPQINNAQEIAWGQATQVVSTAYQKKMKPKAEQMYNDCMRHIILISDDSVRQYLENKLKEGLLSNLSIMYDNIYEAYSFGWLDNCSCDEEALAKEREAEEKERDRLANEQIRKNMEAKKKFEAGEIDENSQLYKKYIKPYEVKINTPFVEGVVGPYKSWFKVKLELPNTPLPTIDFGYMEHHIRNTTTYNGGIEFGKSVELGKAEAGVKAYMKFTATRGTDGQFSVNDIDITGGTKVTLDTMFTSAEVGMEASSVRGAKSYANFAFSGDSLIIEEVKQYMGNWSPDLKLEVWNGEYGW